MPTNIYRIQERWTRWGDVEPLCPSRNGGVASGSESSACETKSQDVQRIQVIEDAEKELIR